MSDTQACKANIARITIRATGGQCAKGVLKKTVKPRANLAVQSRHLVDRVQDESIWLRSPDFADVFVVRLLRVFRRRA